ncbi:hypothetical protein [Alkalinema sp. FACHB-956]|uniref:hypothetical protein n=1 Tax=Alkalinema sp. FACHB-956 TaxID=2692768 RepID=UPI001685D0B8|nr:hypothetical protein [Alkalinema sp. FACHB-956]MBD2327135.1 hypothetical protein [Alkalinema sp. FACHB-956]
MVNSVTSAAASSVTSNVVAALLTKLELLYGKANASGGLASNNSFLSFQFPAIPLSNRDLSFAIPEEAAKLTIQEQQELAANFARLVNLIPAVSQVWSSDQRSLWSVYNQVLTQAAVVDEVWTPAEAAEYQQARALLDSPKFDTYSTYQQAHIAAQTEYLEHKLTADHSTDPAVKQTWLAVEEPLYKAKVDRALNEWTIKGAKLEIEEALRDVSRLMRRRPQVAWEEWQQKFQQSYKTDLENQDFYLTAFYPEDFFRPDRQSTWTKLTLDANEIAALSSKAPEGIRRVADQAGGTTAQAVDLEITKLSVELTRIPILRSWLDPSLFTSPFWRWTDGRPVLSDGQNPPQGQLSAYTTSMIFARNLTIELKPDSAKNAQVISDLQSGKLRLLGPLPLKPIPKTVNPKAIRSLEAGAISLKSADPQLVQQVIAVKRELKISSAEIDVVAAKKGISTIPAEGATVQPKGAQVIDQPAVQQVQPKLDRADMAVNPGVLKRMDLGGIRAVRMEAPAASSQKFQAMDARLFKQVQSVPVRSDLTAQVDKSKLLRDLGDMANEDIARRPGEVFRRPPIRPLPPIVVAPPTDNPPPSPPPTPTPPIVEAIVDMQLIAFICEKLPKAPNPDPNLHW